MYGKFQYENFEKKKKCSEIKARFKIFYVTLIFVTYAV